MLLVRKATINTALHDCWVERIDAINVSLEIIMLLFYADSPLQRKTKTKVQFNFEVTLRLFFTASQKKKLFRNWAENFISTKPFIHSLISMTVFESITSKHFKTLWLAQCRLSRNQKNTKFAILGQNLNQTLTKPKKGKVKYHEKALLMTMMTI